MNDYLRAVEEALADLPASRREALLTHLSERVAARRAELSGDVDLDQEPEHEISRGELREFLDLLGGADFGEPPPDEPMHEPSPSRRLGALAWILVVTAAMVVMCVAAVFTFAFFAVRAGVH